jgi:ureidoglycolate dehydrogenase (NAD+)
MNVRVPQAELLCFARSALEAAGASPEQAQATAEVLVWTDLVGRGTHGVWRLPILCERLRKGGIRGDARPQFERLGPAVGVVRGGGGSGNHIARVAMEHAIQLAQQQGIGAVTAVESNHLGAAGYYVNQAASAGMLGIATSNAFPKVLAHGGRRPALGTNPIGVGAPRADGEALIVDMATSAAAGATIRKIVESDARLEQGVAVDASGKTTSDPKLAGALLPLGGAKGYALGVMVELLCGVLAGPGFGESVRSMYEQPAATGDNGHFMLAIDIARFLPLPLYYERIETLAAWLEASGDPGVVQMPGARRWAARRENAARGIRLDAPTAQALAELCRSLNLPLPRSFTPLAA